MAAGSAKIGFRMSLNINRRVVEGGVRNLEKKCVFFFFFLRLRIVIERWM